MSGSFQFSRPIHRFSIIENKLVSFLVFLVCPFLLLNIYLFWNWIYSISLLIYQYFLFLPFGSSFKNKIQHLLCAMFWREAWLWMSKSMAVLKRHHNYYYTSPLALVSPAGLVLALKREELMDSWFPSGRSTANYSLRTGFWDTQFDWLPKGIFRRTVNEWWVLGVVYVSQTV